MYSVSVTSSTYNNASNNPSIAHVIGSLKCDKYYFISIITLQCTSILRKKHREYRLYLGTNIFPHMLFPEHS